MRTDLEVLQRERISVRENLRISRTSLEIWNSFELIITTSTSDSECVSLRENQRMSMRNLD